MFLTDFRDCFQKLNNYMEICRICFQIWRKVLEFSEFKKRIHVSIHLFQVTLDWACFREVRVLHRLVRAPVPPRCKQCRLHMIPLQAFYAFPERWQFAQPAKRHMLFLNFGTDFHAVGVFFNSVFHDVLLLNLEAVYRRQNALADILALMSRWKSIVWCIRKCFGLRAVDSSNSI